MALGIQMAKYSIDLNVKEKNWLVEAEPKAAILVESCGRDSEVLMLA